MKGVLIVPIIFKPGLDEGIFGFPGKKCSIIKRTIIILNYVSTRICSLHGSGVVKKSVNGPHFFVHSLNEEHLGCFQTIAIMNKGAMNIVEQDS